MKLTPYILPLFAALLSLSSCIKDEPLNAECDILGVDPAWVESHKSSLRGVPIVTNYTVSMQLQKGTDRTALDPKFILTEGATLTTADANGNEVDANGMTRDFSSPQAYTARSQDHNWSKQYEVSFNYPTMLSTLSFEHYEVDDATKRYHVWYEIDADDTTNPRRNYWSTGNPGFALTGMGGKDPAKFPTANDPVGVEGNCVKLTTCATGSFGAMVGMHIAAGSIFIGTFNTKTAMKRPRESTEFGLQLVSGKPERLEGYYKYTEGETFTDKNKQVCPDRHDTADIYAVVFELPYENDTLKNDAGEPILDENGNVQIQEIAKMDPLNGDNVLSSDRIVYMARIDNPGYPSEWSHFSEPFKLMPGKEWDEARLLKDGYAIAVVATSSRQGAYFEGSVGSTLWIDEFKVVWEGDK